MSVVWVIVCEFEMVRSYTAGWWCMMVQWLLFHMQ